MLCYVFEDRERGKKNSLICHFENYFISAAPLINTAPFESIFFLNQRRS